jgi:PilZ domain
MKDDTAHTGNVTLADGVGRPANDGAEERNQRREMRLQCDPSKVLLELAENSEPLEAQVVGVSKSGLQLRLGTSVAAGESVRVTHAKMVISGQIRYCRPNDVGAFDAGVEILNVQCAH